MNFYDRLDTAWKFNNSVLCIGLDADIEIIKDYEKSIFEFNKNIIDATHDLVCAYKPQISYYNAYGLERELEMTIEYIKTKYPDILVILDSKRGDIGKTSELYAIEAYDRYKADCVTVNPYMGSDSVEPFTRYKDKGVIVLCKTSNPSSSEIQSLRIKNETEEKKVYEEILDLCINKWNSNKNIAVVMGATQVEELAHIRSLSDEVPFLIPGVGAQGGDIEDVVNNAKTSKNKGMIINSSRAIIYASKDVDYAKNARIIAKQTRDEINQYI
ncbi:MAG: Orotidine 5'-phosphate decarboxylase (EC [uncultured Campylobacterales bacterium]|uniref:Orotidine 5'-phosphate decarboxylase n=1 Tax=uncultured Campylobacterales bacterium TaxID=352960 RepID=A0A6S6S1L9_9BACT|nr:MAG: Orotidine 5'-phosphate decarboxylase (EC [uncultured Campylobacterales bacterium]